jgi:hypothetical protein
MTRPESIRRLVETGFCLPAAGKAVPAGADWFREINTTATAFALSVMDRQFA